MNSARPAFALATPTSRRTPGLAACAALAVVLNAGAIGIATSASSVRPNVAVSTSGDKPLGAMMLVALRDEPIVSASALDAAPRDATVHQSAAPKLPKLLAADTVLAASSELASQPPIFYGFHEVDQPAFPESDWNLDVESLDAIGVQRLAFEVLISDAGAVVGCTVLAPTDLADDVKHGLEQRLSATRLLPAERNGQLVASVRRIELAVNTVPLDVSLAAAAHRP
jgi:hypothetical protein